MAHEFELHEEIALDATPEQVWQAITTGPGVDSWFMGRTEIEQGLGGAVRMSLLGGTQEATVTGWEPGKRFAYQGEPGPDGVFMAFEFLIEGREQGTTVLRFVHSGMLGDDWEAEYDALSEGDRMYLEKLAGYLRHFPGRTSSHNLFLPGPAVADAERVWRAVGEALGIGDAPQVGDRARVAVEGLAPVEGVVDFVRRPTYVGVRTGDGVYTLIHGHRDTLVVEYHGFSGGVDASAIERAWQGWLAGFA